MLDMIEMGKDLIKKGEELNDEELLTMGYSMLAKYSPEANGDNGEVVVSDGSELAKYVCSHCQHEIPYDKPGRKKCPACKKHTLVLISPPQPKPPSDSRVKAEDFSTQIRNSERSRTRYDDDGNVVGIYTKTEPVNSVTNVWNDDRTEGFDEANELLKKFTKVSPRTRQPTRLMSVTCESCKTTYNVHPIHVGGRAKYVCDRCMRKRTRI